MWQFCSALCGAFCGTLFSSVSLRPYSELPTRNSLQPHTVLLNSDWTSEPCCLLCSLPRAEACLAAWSEVCSCLDPELSRKD